MKHNFAKTYRVGNIMFGFTYLCHTSTEYSLTHIASIAEHVGSWQQCGEKLNILLFSSSILSLLATGTSSGLSNRQSSSKPLP